MKTQIINRRKAITLLEVLVSVFVIGIGLIGVLAVIPFGAYQISKANAAHYTANMLANAENDLRIRGLAKPECWKDDIGGAAVTDSDGNVIYNAGNLDCTKIVLVDADTKKENIWKEIFRGQDDFDYQVDEATNKPDWTNKKSTGRYTWFFTYRLSEAIDNSTPPANWGEVPLANLTTPVAVDLLGCRNRSSADDLDPLTVSGYQPALGGGTLTLNVLPADKEKVLESLGQTKYALVTWDDTPARNGAWCKILFTDNTPKIIVSAEGIDIPENLNTRNGKVRIMSGVLYHKRIEEIDVK